MLGIAVAVVFGVMFIRGSVKINLQRFFRVTSVILYFVTFQLIVSGLHELSENGVLPSSQAEMRYIGPIVRNDLFFFVTMLALAALMILMEQRRRQPATDLGAPRLDSETSTGQPQTPAALRKAAWTQRRETMWMTAVISASFLFIFLSTAEFIYAKSSTALSEPSPVTLVGDQVTVPTSQVTDDKLHRYSVHVDNNGHTTEVRFLLFRKPDGNIVTVADACTICGPVGFYIGSRGHHLQDVRQPPQRRLHGPARRLQPHPPEVHHQRGPGHHHRRRPPRRRTTVRKVTAVPRSAATTNLGAPCLASETWDGPPQNSQEVECSFAS